jgi:hypothetical protein
MLTLWVLLIIAVACWFWSDSLAARERVLRAARLTCAQVQVQLLDQTVALARLELGRDQHGRRHLRRLYAFEFSTDGAQRFHGQAALLGKVVHYVHLDHPDGSTFVQMEPSGLTVSARRFALGSSDATRNKSEKTP